MRKTFTASGWSGNSPSIRSRTCDRSAFIGACQPVSYSSRWASNQSRLWLRASAWKKRPSRSANPSNRVGATAFGMSRPYAERPAATSRGSPAREIGRALLEEGGDGLEVLGGSDTLREGVVLAGPRGADLIGTRRHQEPLGVLDRLRRLARDAGRDGSDRGQQLVGPAEPTRDAERDRTL